MYQPGTYRARLCDHKLGVNDKGTLVLSIPVQIMGYYQGDEYVEEAGNEPRTVYLYLTPDTLGDDKQPGFVTRTLRGLGYDHPGLDQLDPEHKEAFSFDLQEATLTCKHEEYGGKLRERWEFHGQKKELASPSKDMLSKLSGYFRSASKSVKTKDKLPI